MLHALLHLLLPVALAGGSASPAPPPPPEVDFATLAKTATAQPPDYAEGKKHPVVARLLLEKDKLVAGESARIGLHLKQDEG